MRSSSLRVAVFLETPGAEADDFGEVMLFRDTGQLLFQRYRRVAGVPSLLICFELLLHVFKSVVDVGIESNGRLPVDGAVFPVMEIRPFEANVGPVSRVNKSVVGCPERDTAEWMQRT